MTLHVVCFVHDKMSERRQNGILAVFDVILQSAGTVNEQKMVVADYNRSICKFFLCLEIEAFGCILVSNFLMKPASS